MNGFVAQATQRFLEDFELRAEPDAATGGPFIPVTAVGESHQNLLIGVKADEEQREALVGLHLQDVPADRRAAVALVLAELNARVKFVSFSLMGGHVLAAVWVELAPVDDVHAAAALIGLAFIRLVSAVDASFDAIAQAAAPRGPTPSVHRQVAELLDQLDLWFPNQKGA